MKSYFGHKILVLLSPGLARIVLFRSTASEVLETEKKKDKAPNLTKLAKTITNEMQSMPHNKWEYQKHINLDTAMANVSPTLELLLTKLSTKVGRSLPEALVGTMITSAVAARSTPLRVALAVLTREKTLVKHFLKMA